MFSARDAMAIYRTPTTRVFFLTRRLSPSGMHTTNTVGMPVFLPPKLRFLMLPIPLLFFLVGIIGFFFSWEQVGGRRLKTMIKNSFLSFAGKDKGKEKEGKCV